MNAEPAPTKKPKSGWLNLVVDYGPILVFFLVYKHYSPADPDKHPVTEVMALVSGTIGFMVAAVVALVFSRLKFGRISPMLWISTVLVVGFGSLTVLLHDPFWVQVKPTVFYVTCGTVLLLGVWRGKALLKYLLEAAFEGLSEIGWLKLSRNWGLFFFVLAALNEVLRHLYNLDNGHLGTWISLKLYLFVPLTFLFTFLHIPMLLRHGMADEEKAEAMADEPTPQ